eukprot:GEMP01021150.1.p1 GENE.GEMP01021150.1~~GEMP01021150.1.p1  ORF type:complete len:357 (+),score=62.70 GEMP01021150.1:185-1255(+)
MYEIDELKAMMRALPFYALYPEIGDEALDVVAQWRIRYSAKIWYRFMKMDKEAAHKVPRLLKELNETAPILHRLAGWLQTVERASVFDLGSGFGFFGMFVADMPRFHKVTRVVLVDKSLPNAHIDVPNGNISTDHILGHQRPIETLKINLKKCNQLVNFIKKGLHLCEPVALCAIHLCNTLALRAIQIFHLSPTTGFFALAPCCMPSRRHLIQEVVYEVNGHRFGLPPVKKNETQRARFLIWLNELSIALGSPLEIIPVHHNLNAYYFTERATILPSALPRELTGEGFDKVPPVVVDATYIRRKKQLALELAERGCEDEDIDSVGGVASNIRDVHDSLAHDDQESVESPECATGGS